MNAEAFILVGGRSSRFGGEKSLALLGGETLAERAVKTVREAIQFSKISFVTRDAGHFEKEAERLGARCVPDLPAGIGPVGGLHAALARCEAEWLFLFACDLPFVDSELIATLWQTAEAGPSSAVVPRQADGRLQPLCAFYNTGAVRPVVEDLIVQAIDPPSMRQVLSSLELRIVEPGLYGGDDRFRNINTREDLERAEGN